METLAHFPLEKVSPPCFSLTHSWLNPKDHEAQSIDGNIFLWLPSSALATRQPNESMHRCAHIVLPGCRHKAQSSESRCAPCSTASTCYGKAMCKRSWINRIKI